jgi:hypothetical protein
MGWRLYVQDENQKEVISFSRNSEVYDRLSNLPIGWYDNEPIALNSESLEFEIDELTKEISDFKTRIFMEFAVDKNVSDLLSSHEYLEELIETRTKLVMLRRMSENFTYFLWGG